MNYNMQGINGNDSQALRDAEINEGRNQEKHQVLMVDKTTSFNKRAKGRRGTSRRTASKLLLKWRSPSLVLSLRLSASTAKGTGHWKRNCPKYLADKKDGKVNKGIFDIQIIDVYLLLFVATPQYLILVQLLRVVTRNRSCRINRD